MYLFSVQSQSLTSPLQQELLWGVEFVGAFVGLLEPLFLLLGEVGACNVVDIAPVLLLGQSLNHRGV